MRKLPQPVIINVVSNRHGKIDYNINLYKCLIYVEIRNRIVMRIIDRSTEVEKTADAFAESNNNAIIIGR